MDSRGRGFESSRMLGFEGAGLYLLFLTLTG